MSEEPYLPEYDASTEEGRKWLVAWLRERAEFDDDFGRAADLIEALAKRVAELEEDARDYGIERDLRT